MRDDGFSYSDLFDWHFTKMITPAVVKSNYQFGVWIVIILGILGTVGVTIGASQAGALSIVLGAIAGVVFGLIGLVIVMMLRITAERALIQFAQFEELKAIARRPAAPEAPRPSLSQAFAPQLGTVLGPGGASQDDQQPPEDPDANYKPPSPPIQPRRPEPSKPKVYGGG